jgi:soluble lytic murein transglycosylase-like protein
MLACLACVPLGTAQAAEQITLKNGFELKCDHRGPVDSATGKLRLFLDTGEGNYLDVRPGEIASSETLPQTPAAVPVVPAQAAPGRSPLAPPARDLSPAELHQLLAANGSEHNLSVDLLASVVHAESAGHTHAQSRTGARGLMQLMPGTAAQLGVADRDAPDQNVRGGTAYLDALLRRYHDNLALALAAYNAGPGAVDRYHGIPPYRETRLYVAHIIHEFNRRYDAAQHAAAVLAYANPASAAAAPSR